MRLLKTRKSCSNWYRCLGNAGGKAQGRNLGQAISLPRERVREFQHEAHRYLAAQHSQAGPSGVPPPVAEHAAGDPMAVDSMQQSVRGMSIEENGYGHASAIPSQQVYLLPHLPFFAALKVVPSLGMCVLRQPLALCRLISC